MVVAAGVVVVAGAAVVAGAVVLVLVEVVEVVDSGAEPAVSIAVVVEVGSAVVGDTIAGTAELFAAPDVPGAPMLSAESERSPPQPATAANATTSKMAEVRTDRT